ncbi:MAG: PKD domain-containing protein [bacterium]|nr:PKD domain-containing protein [bacterium]
MSAYYKIIIFFCCALLAPSFAFGSNHQSPEVTSVIPVSKTMGNAPFTFFVYGDNFSRGQGDPTIHLVNYPMALDYEYGAPFINVDNNEIERSMTISPVTGPVAALYIVIVENNGDFSDEINVTFTVYNAPPTADDLSVSSDACPALPDVGSAYFFWTYNDIDSDSEKKFQFQVARSTDPNFTCEDSLNPAYPCPINRTYDNLSNPAGTLNQQAVSIEIDGDEQDALTYGRTYYWRVKVWEQLPVAPYQSDNSGWVNGANYTTISRPWPYVDFSYTATSPAMNFTNNSICYDADETCNSYLWSFGDGQNSNLKNPSHAYSPPASYDVSLVVTDGDGLQCEAIETVNAPNPAFSTGNPFWKEISPFKVPQPGGPGGPTVACNDGDDNDGDGLTDWPDDPNCSTGAWLSEYPQCSNGWDDDSDGFTDYLSDSGCVSPDDDVEADGFCFLAGQVCTPPPGGGPTPCCPGLACVQQPDPMMYKCQ